MSNLTELKRMLEEVDLEELADEFIEYQYGEDWADQEDLLGRVLNEFLATRNIHLSEDELANLKDIFLHKSW